MKFLRCSWYDTQEKKKCAVSSTILQKVQITVLLIILLNNTSRTSKSFVRIRSVLTQIFLGYSASISRMLFLTLGPEYFEYTRLCLNSRRDINTNTDTTIPILGLQYQYQYRANPQYQYQYQYQYQTISILQYHF